MSDEPNRTEIAPVSTFSAIRQATVKTSCCAPFPVVPQDMEWTGWRETIRTVETNSVWHAIHGLSFRRSGIIRNIAVPADSGFSGGVSYLRNMISTIIPPAGRLR